MHASLQRRIERLERRIGATPTTETPAETSRRVELVKAAGEGREPGDLTPEERPVFAQIAASVPILQELVREGTIGPDGLPSGGHYPHHNDVVDEDEDGDDQVPVWHP
ncbi:MAG: hypothetical protein M3R38_17725 [Actinomycetota bacterium]|nr:hypothetical protein [Actinomycetota bacterium]